MPLIDRVGKLEDAGAVPKGTLTVGSDTGIELFVEGRGDLVTGAAPGGTMLLLVGTAEVVNGAVPAGAVVRGAVNNGAVPSAVPVAPLVALLLYDAQ